MSTPPKPDPRDGGHVTVEIADGVGTVSFFHPKSNSLPGVILRRLAADIETLGANPAVTVIVLRSDGTGPFCAGASFDKLTAVKDMEGGREFFSGFAKVILATMRAPKFVLTRVHGKTAGGGIGIVAASDYSFAVKTASAKLSELALGIGPFVVGPVIEKKIGLAAFTAMSVDADWRTAEWCERHGLYSQLYDTVAEMDTAIAKLAKTLAASNPAAMAKIKQVVWAGTEHWDALLATRAGISGDLVLSDFTRRAIERIKAK